MYQDETPDLHEAIRQYIWQKEQRPYHFGKREVGDIAEATGEPQEEVERVFFDLAGAVWAGVVHVRHGGDRPVYGPGTPPQGWSYVAFDREWMWRQGTLPERRRT